MQKQASELIKKRAEDLGWSLQTLAEKLGTGVEELNHYFNSDYPLNLKALDRIAGVLGIELEVRVKKTSILGIFKKRLSEVRNTGS